MKAAILSKKVPATDQEILEAMRLTMQLYLHYQQDITNQSLGVRNKGKKFKGEKVTLIYLSQNETMARIGKVISQISRMSKDNLSKRQRNVVRITLLAIATRNT